MKKGKLGHVVQIGVNVNLNRCDVEQKGREHVRRQRKTGESKRAVASTFSR